jgi:predicted TIM-barrel fold metal-dependent hydrolase
MQIINCHTHTFTFEHVPKYFIPFGLVRILARSDRYRKLARVLNSLNPFSDKDIFNRYSKFIEQGYAGEQKHVLESLLRFYPEGTKFVVLSMDMDYMGAGKAKRDFEAQLSELAALKREYGDILYPFIFAHPFRKNLLDLVKRYIEEQQFAGIKLYPPLGYYPFDERLYPLFEYAQDNDIPVLSHCTPQGVYYRGKIKEEWLTHPLTGESLKKRRNRNFTDVFTDPDNFEYVLQNFCSLKLCFAHFGGAEEWRRYQNSGNIQTFSNSWFAKIKRILLNPKYPNTYADISYTLADEDLYPLLHLLLLNSRLREKVLFGSDFYMANIEGSEYAFSIRLRHQLGEKNYRQIAEINPSAFLRSSFS